MKISPNPSIAELRTMTLAFWTAAPSRRFLSRKKRNSSKKDENLTKVIPSPWTMIHDSRNKPLQTIIFGFRPLGFGFLL
jgi:hypothetical protein